MVAIAETIMMTAAAPVISGNGDDDERKKRKVAMGMKMRIVLLLTRTNKHFWTRIHTDLLIAKHCLRRVKKVF